MIGKFTRTRDILGTILVAVRLICSIIVSQYLDISSDRIWYMLLLFGLENIFFLIENLFSVVDALIFDY